MALQTLSNTVTELVCIIFATFCSLDETIKNNNTEEEEADASGPNRGTATRGEREEKWQLVKSADVRFMT